NEPMAAAQLRAPLYEDKVVDYLFDKAEVTDRAVTKEELEAAIEAEDGDIKPHVHGPDCGQDHDEKPKAKKAASKKAAAEPAAEAEAVAEEAPAKPKKAAAKKAAPAAAEADAPAAEAAAEEKPKKKAAPKKAAAKAE
ncbi:MAG: trigger factor, partial [Alphaproteobacteria bacterium]|nr:trigger factor [Alphaproteobacteria bacterium]